MTENTSSSGEHNTPSLFASLLAGVIFLGLFCGFIALGVWQVQRLAWKNNLVAQVEMRAHQKPVPAPAKEKWPEINAECCAYQPVYITGRFLNGKEVLVTAVTEYGSGYWLMTPLQAADGTITFINRGFVPMDNFITRASIVRDFVPPDSRHENRNLGEIEGETTVTGLLRIGEPNNMLWRKNNPQTDRWVMRNLPAMAQARGLTDVAPYFIDADKTSNRGGIPIGGLTRVTFTNNHLTYAITWFVLAGGMAVAIFFTLRPKKRQRKTME